jgi:hypothetical protein
VNEGQKGPDAIKRKKKYHNVQMKYLNATQLTSTTVPAPKHKVASTVYCTDIPLYENHKTMRKLKLATQQLSTQQNKLHLLKQRHGRLNISFM